MAKTDATPIGARFGCWTVTGPAENGSKGQSQWSVRCDCGTERTRITSVIRYGYSKSCGCQIGELVAARNTKHGHAAGGTRSRGYTAWRNMIERCRNPNSQNFHRYGGRGVLVCDRWLNFSNFLADMGEPAPGLTLDRKDNGLVYGPGFCRWASRAEQYRNRSTNVWIDTCRGRMIIEDIASAAGLCPSSMRKRIAKGVTGEALFAPRSDRSGKPRHLHDPRPRPAET